MRVFRQCNYRQSMTYDSLSYNFLTLQWLENDTQSVETIV